MTPIGTRVYRPEPLGAAMSQRTDDEVIAFQLQCDEVAAWHGHMQLERLKLILRMLDDGMWHDDRVGTADSRIRRVKFSTAQRFSFECIAKKALELREAPLVTGAIEYSVVDGKIQRRLPT